MPRNAQKSGKKSRMGTYALFGILLALRISAVSSDSGEAVIRNAARFSPPGSSLAFYRGEVCLSAAGIWRASLPQGATNVSELYLLPPSNAAAARALWLNAAAAREKDISSGRDLLEALYWPCREYAARNNNIGPAKIEDLDARIYDYLLDAIRRASDAPDRTAEKPPPVFLVPGARFPNGDAGEALREVLAVETQPRVGDGLQWILYTDGLCRREPIRRELAEKHRFEMPAPTSTNQQVPPALTYKMLLAAPCAFSDPFTIILTDASSGASLTSIWQPQSSPEKESDVLHDLREARTAAWNIYAGRGSSLIIDAWLRLYGKNPAGTASEERDSPVQFLAPEGLMGGVMALRKFRPPSAHSRAADDEISPSVPLAAVAAMANIRHSPRQTRASSGTAEPPFLARYCPPDRLFLYSDNPSAIAGLLMEKSPFISALAVEMTGVAMSRDVPGDLAGRLGIGIESFARFLSSGAVRDLAVIIPEMDILDGSDVSVVMRLNGKSGTNAWSELGLAPPAEPAAAIHTHQGQSAFWSLQNGILMGSSCRAEFDAIRALVSTDGTNCLAQNSDLGKALAICHGNGSSVLCLFASPDFWRRVGSVEYRAARVKRLKAIGDMHEILAGALLARLDGVNSAATNFAALAEQGYLSQEIRRSDEYVMGPDLCVRSKTWGPLSSPSGLFSAHVESLTLAESDMLRSELDELRRYGWPFCGWVSVSMETTTEPDQTRVTLLASPAPSFPLRRLLSEVAEAPQNGESLRIPSLKPEPAAMYSVVLRRNIRERLAESLGGFLRENGASDASFLEGIGPSVHIAFYDEEPLPAAAANSIRDVVEICKALAALPEQKDLIRLASRRRFAMAMELKDPGRARRALSLLAEDFAKAGNCSGTSLFMHACGEESSAWIAGLAQGERLCPFLRAEIDGRFLLAQSVHAGESVRICRLDPVPTSILTVRIRHAGRSGAAVEASQTARRAVFYNMSALYPLVASGFAAADNSPAEYERLCGVRPIHIGRGNWVWNDFALSSTTYGTISAPRVAPAQSDPSAPAYLTIQLREDNDLLMLTSIWKKE